MTLKADPPLSRQIASDIRIWLLSVLCAILVFAIAIFMQWLIYDDWLHDKGPLRVVGSILAAGLTFAVALRWQFAIRWRKLEMLRRFESIKWMNDRIRNSLQAIEFVTFAADPQATESVRDAVDAIEDVLKEVLAESHPAPDLAAVTNQSPPVPSIAQDSPMKERPEAASFEVPK